MLRHDIAFVYIVLDRSMDASDDWRSLLQLNTEISVIEEKYVTLLFLFN